jgi:peptidyl-dipeptidase Dcp
MKNVTSSCASSRILRVTCAVTLLFAIGCAIVPLCEAATPAAPSPNSSKKVDTKTTGNPLLTESTLPYQLPPFDKIKDEHFQPALEQGIAEEEKEADTIAKQTEKPTFENTIVPLEKMGQLLLRARRIFSNFTAANTNPALQEIEKEMAPKFSAHSDAIRLNGPLFARVEALYNEREKSGLDSESKWLLERYYKDFVRAGARLSEADKTKLKALNAELATLQTTFEQNVLKEKNASSILVSDRAELAGLSDNEIAAASAAAKADGKEGKFVIRLLNTTGQPALASLQNRPLREKIMQTSLARNSHGGEWDNKAVVSRTARLRAERAALLGYANHAAYQLDDIGVGEPKILRVQRGGAFDALLHGPDFAGPAVLQLRRR